MRSGWLLASVALLALAIGLGFGLWKTTPGTPEISQDRLYAVKFTDQGGVTVRASYSEADGGQLRVSVIDTGCGIPADKVERLFQRFSQADSSISRTHGGTGLGLAICRSLAEMMGGETGIESREGAGSTFWFTIAAPSAELSAQAVHIDADHGDR